YVESSVADAFQRPLRDLFDVPDLNATDDRIVNGEYETDDIDGIMPLSPFTAQRVDYSLHRLSHYTATRPVHFQNYVLFTNYQFYIDEFCALARRLMAEGGGGYERFIEPGNLITEAGDDAPTSGVPIGRLPQMPAYHLAK
ncbi:hypothetical protein LXJ58_31500, partial [Escherichia coli]|nr:hypothetical protein [Escherichia coli]